ncbi:MAG: hypothetical protein KJ697_00165 [Nanoarchaeota archaeon]|nr:hypothetical protein [Nanoarchaeota archaeon]MBU4072427.1 hypothetical protein [Candidatus Thermoplasmatota archaeon]
MKTKLKDCLKQLNEEEKKQCARLCTRAVADARTNCFI